MNRQTQSSKVLKRIPQYVRTLPSHVPFFYMRPRTALRGDPRIGGVARSRMGRGFGRIAGANPASCRFSASCDPGFVCTGNIASPGQCVAGGPVSCRANASCARGYICTGNLFSAGQCVKGCAWNSRCLPGYNCVNGKCYDAKGVVDQ